MVWCGPLPIFCSVTLDDLPAFDPTSKCIKCGWSIPEPPPAEPKFGPKGADGVQKQLPAPPPPPPDPPTVMYCDGTNCEWKDAESTDDIEEHMHQWCDTCGFEWLARPLDAG